MQRPSACVRITEGMLIFLCLAGILCLYQTLADEKMGITKYNTIFERAHPLPEPNYGVYLIEYRGF